LRPFVAGSNFYSSGTAAESMLIDLSILLVLILFNGVFAMSEIAIVGSKRARLLQMAESGSAGARRALSLASQPTRFLSSVQVGITAIGIMNGAIGEASVASRLRVVFAGMPALAAYAEPLAVGVMVVLLTYVSLILGELVPKRLALTHPEAIASLISRPMDVLARAGRPIVYLLSLSTDGVLRLLGVRATSQPLVTLDEIRVLLEQGADEGAVDSSEHEMMTNVLDLDRRRVASVLTPRSEVVYLDVRHAMETHRERLRRGSHSVLPLCDGGLDDVIGVIRSTRLLEQLMAGPEIDLRALAEPALFVPETMTLMTLLQHFKHTHLPVALVVDEFGVTQGLVSLTDVTSSIVGELPMQPGDEAAIVRRDDGSWLIDGALELSAVGRALGTDALEDEAAEIQYHTLGGLVMAALGRVPRTGDAFARAGYRFEVVDMDGNRVDRVWVRPEVPEPPGGSPAA
jgi:putative hemolysin